jgi:mono/diheme cytochrome c family protein
LKKVLAVSLVLTFAVFVVAISVSAQSGVDAPGIWKKSCAPCHKLDGKGGPMKTPDMTSKEWQTKRTDEQMIKVITNGEKMMPKFEGKLKPEEIKALVTEVIRKMAK